MSHSIYWWKRKRGAPAIPEAPTVAVRSTTQILMSWPAVIGATGYIVERSLDGATWATLATISTRSYVDSGLTAATTYYYRVRSTSQAGTSQPSPVLATSTTTDPQPPATPAAPTVGLVTATTIDLSWPAVADATAYTLQRAVGTSTTWATWASGMITSFTDTALDPSSTYRYRLSVTNPDGTSGFSPDASATTTATPVVPAAPATPTASAVTINSATLTWPAVSGATSYTLQRSTSATTGFATLSPGPGRATSYSDTPLAAATTYYYRVSASNTAGTSGYSPTRSVVTPAIVGGTVQPVAAQYVVRRSGVRVAPNANSATSEYKGDNADAIVRRVADMGMSFVRGMTAPSLSSMPQYVAACRKYKIDWLMLLIPEGFPAGQTVLETRQKIRAIIANGWHDICYGLEGLNEPNHNRGGQPVTSDWAQVTVDHQRAIWEEMQGTVLQDKLLIGPSLQDINADNSYDTTIANPEGGKRHFHQLLDLGILNYQDCAGMHTYPTGGTEPETNLQKRLDRMRSAYGANYPVFPTEWGYTNYKSGSTPATAGTYGPRGFLQFILNHSMNPERNDPDRNILAMTYYELLDNYDPTNLDRENFFGMYSVSQVSTSLAVSPATWTPKPVATKVGAMLNRMQDPLGTAAYTPTPVRLSVSSSATDILWWCTATKAQSDAGTATVWLVRDQPVGALEKSVTVTDRNGARTIPVGDEVYGLDLR